MSGKRFCVVNTESSDIWRPITFADMFRSGFEWPGDEWTACNVANGEPLPDDILSYQGVVFSGSHFNCRDRDSLPWFHPVCEFIRAAAETGSPRLYGGCFGCQIIAFALGGEVDCNPGGRFILKAEDVKWAHCECTSSDDCACTPHTVPVDLVNRLKSSPLNLLVSHGDCVRKTPPGAKLIAHSSSCHTEMFIAGSRHNVWACQSHPELDLQYAIWDRIWHVVVDQRHRLSPEEEELARTTLNAYTGEDAKFVLRAIGDFLHEATASHHHPHRHQQNRHHHALADE